MATVEIVMPQMGESIAEGTILKWHKKVGDPIERDETLLEISTDKVDSEIPSPSAGTLVKILVNENETVPVHTIIAHIDPNDGSEGKAIEKAPPEEKMPEPEQAREQSTVDIPRAEPVEMEDKPKDRFYSPLVLNIAREEKIGMAELEQIPGTGTGGRVSKKDILAYIQDKKAGKKSIPTEVAPRKPVSDGERIEVVPMDKMRKLIAEHMVRSVHTSAHVSSVTEADMTAIARYRDRHKDAFERREGFKLTFTPFFIDAIIKAIKQYPIINSSIEGDSLLIRKYINIGVAVALDNGLIVPVIKHADEKNLTGLARAVNDLAVRARSKKLSPDDVQGGTFTLTNPGIFGNLWGAPIINQPQVAILATGAIKKRPVVIDDAIAIRSMVYISMSYDHRIIDGMLGGMFLQAIVKHLEAFDINQKI